MVGARRFERVGSSEGPQERDVSEAPAYEAWVRST